MLISFCRFLSAVMISKKRSSFSSCPDSRSPAGWGVTMAASQLILGLIDARNGHVDVLLGHGLLVDDPSDDVLVLHLVSFNQTLLPMSLSG